MLEGYEFYESSYKEEEKEKDIQIEEEVSPKRIPQTPKYVQKNHSEYQIIGDKSRGMLTRINFFMTKE